MKPLKPVGTPAMRLTSRSRGRRASRAPRTASGPRCGAPDAAAVGDAARVTTCGTARATRRARSRPRTGAAALAPAPGAPGARTAGRRRRVRRGPAGLHAAVRTVASAPPSDGGVAWHPEKGRTGNVRSGPRAGSRRTGPWVTLPGAYAGPRTIVRRRARTEPSGLRGNSCRVVGFGSRPRLRGRRAHDSSSPPCSVPPSSPRRSSRRRRRSSRGPTRARGRPVAGVVRAQDGAPLAAPSSRCPRTRPTRPTRRAASPSARRPARRRSSGAARVTRSRRWRSMPRRGREVAVTLAPLARRSACSTSSRRASARC